MIGQLHMASEIYFALEGFATLDAGEGFVARVLATVGDEVRRLAERLAADGTLMGFLASMYVGVFLHVGLLMEPLAAVGAWIGSGVTVDEEVGGQCGGSLEALAALLALKRAFFVRLSAPVGTGRKIQW